MTLSFIRINSKLQVLKIETLQILMLSYFIFQYFLWRLSVYRYQSTSIVVGTQLLPQLGVEKLIDEEAEEGRRHVGGRRY